MVELDDIRPGAKYWVVLRSTKAVVEVNSIGVTVDDLVRVSTVDGCASLHVDDDSVYLTKQEAYDDLIYTIGYNLGILAARYASELQKLKELKVERDK